MTILRSSAQSPPPPGSLPESPSYRDLSSLLTTYEINNGKPSLALIFRILTMPTEQVIPGVYYLLRAGHGDRTQQHTFHL